MTTGRVMPTVSHSWNASWPMALDRHLAGNDHHRNRIHVGGRQAGYRIGDAGAGSDQRHADFLRTARIGVGGMHRGLFVAHQNVLEFVLIEDGVVDIQDGAAGIAEHVFDAFLGQAAHDNFGAGDG